MSSNGRIPQAAPAVSAPEHSTAGPDASGAGNPQQQMELGMVRRTADPEQKTTVGATRHEEARAVVPPSATDADANAAADAADDAPIDCCAKWSSKGHYESLIKAGWIIFWLEGVQLVFWFASGIYICAFTTDKFAVAHLLSALHFTGSIGIAEVTEHLERAQELHEFPEPHFERSWDFLFLLTLLADVLLLLDVVVYLPRDPVAGFVIEMFIGAWAMATGVIIFVWAVVVAVRTRRVPAAKSE